LGYRLGRQLKLNERRTDTGANKVVLDAILKLSGYHGFELELPLEVRAHLALHPIDIAELRRTMYNDALDLIAVNIIAVVLVRRRGVGVEEMVVKVGHAHQA
jgi:hypothetical protein